MAGEKDHALAAASWPEIVQRIRARTPARLLVGRAGSAYPTSTQLELREAHAAARDAVWAELDTRAIFTEKFLDQWKLFEASTRAANKQELEGQRHSNCYRRWSLGCSSGGASSSTDTSSLSVRD